VKAPVTVKVVDEVPAKLVKLTAKGSIDVLNRDTTEVVYTPKLGNVTGQISDVALTGSAAHLFNAELREDGKIAVTAKADAELITKYDYSIRMELTLDNGYEECTITTGSVKLKVTQSKPKVTASPKLAVVFNNVSDSAADISITAQNKNGTSVAIESVKLTNFNDVFSYEKGEDDEDGKLILKDRGKVVKGKTYTLKLEVRFKDDADNEKVTVVSYKVKVQ
jgi:hypothetical protein